MNEKTPTPEELQKLQLEQEEREDDERWKAWIEKHPEPVIPIAPTIRSLTPEEVEKYKIRIVAKKDLNPNKVDHER